MKKTVICVLLSALVLGGCGLWYRDISNMDPEDLPDVTAFQDDFTREFMASTKEVEKGYYLFQSKTRKYMMLFPEDARIYHPPYYERSHDKFEMIWFDGANDKITGKEYQVKAIYMERIKIGADIQLEVLAAEMGYEGDYQKYDHKDKTIYVADMKFPREGDAVFAHSFFGVVQSNHSKQTLNYIYTVYCGREEEDCDFDLEGIGNHVKKLMESIKFK